MTQDELARLLGESSQVFASTMAGMALSAREAEALEEALRTRPGDLDVRARLIGYYAGQELGGGRGGPERVAHVRWLVEHAPASDLAGSTYARTVPVEARAELEALWRRTVTAGSPSAATYFNAGRFLEPTAPDEAKRLLEEARRLDPSLPEPPSMEALINALPPPPAEDARAPDGPQHGFSERTEALHTAIRNGRAGAMEAEAIALLKEAEQFRGDWNHGNAVHYGHTALGLAAFERGEVKEAARRLLLAGATPGSPQLDSFGPTFVLAQRLLEAGAKAAVLAYLDLCARFWEFGRGRLDAWRREIHQGATPRFGLKFHT